MIHHAIPRRSRVFAGACLLLMGVVGCDQFDFMPGPSGSKLAIGDFADENRSEDVRLSQEESGEALMVSGLRPAEPMDYTTLLDETEETFFDIRVSPGESVIVDSLIGQVNGRPLYADEVLGPIADQLNAEYSQLVEDATPPNWDAFQRTLIKLVGAQLQELVLNELYLSEARAGLTAQEKTGLMAFMQNLREELVGERGGVFGEAEQQIMQEEGLTWEEYLKMQEDQLLIRSLMHEKIQPNIVMSWKDVERLYNARKDQFQPDPTVTLGRIRVRTEGNDEKIKTIQEMFDAGDSFEIVAGWAGAPDDGVWDKFKMGKGGVTDIEVADFYKTHLEGLGPGETSKSFVRGNYTIWVSVIEISDPEHKDLYDPAVQSMLQGELLNRKMTQARQEFIENLLEAGIYDNLNQMQMRVIAIALSRYKEGR
ncbi:MAG: hypothetical protein VX527_12420 [Planctomycetota bacterium]|nr:hypothetical protein [Planctomycetota bacterium]